MKCCDLLQADIEWFGRVICDSTRRHRKRDSLERSFERRKEMIAIYTIS